MKRVAIIGDIYPESWKQSYLDELESRGIEAKFIDVENLIITLQTGSQFSTNYSLTDFDTIIFLTEVYEKLYHYITLLFQDKNILNGESIRNYPIFSDKFYQAILFSKFNVLHPMTAFSINAKNVETNFPVPLLLKKLGASLESHSGIGVIRISNLAQLYAQYLTNPKSTFEAQELLINKEVSDFRTIYLNETFLGTIKRTSLIDFRTNGTDHLEKVNDHIEFQRKVKEILIQYKIEYAAVDYIVYKGKQLILEINRFPHMGKPSQDLLGVQIIPRIVDFLLSMEKRAAQ